MDNSSDQEWQVEKILQRGRFKNVTHYLILWKGFKPQDATWEPITNLQHCQQAIMDFQKQVKQGTTPLEHKKQGRRSMNFRKVFEEKQVSQQSNVKKEGRSTQRKQSKKVKQSLEKKKQNSISYQEYKKLVESKDKQFSKQMKQYENKCQFDPDQSLETKKRKIVLEEQNDQGQITSSKKIKENQNPKDEDILQTNDCLPGIFVKVVHSTQATPENQIQRQRNLPRQQSVIHIPSKPQQVDKCDSEKVSEQTSSNSKNPPRQTPQIQKIKSNRDPSNQNTSSKYAVQFYSPSLEGYRILGYTLPDYSLLRYNFCDEQYKKRQKQALINMVKKVHNQPRIKSKINMVDISRNPEYLQELGSIEKVCANVIFQSIDLFVKIDYGWLIVGKNVQNKFVMTNVNSIQQQNWKALQKKLNEKSRN